MSKIFEEFKNRYLGAPVDVDGKYGSQCFDLFNAWNRDYNGCTLSGAPSGYAKSLAENKANNGILNYFTETTVDNMIEGTAVVYGECPIAPLSHVCFFIEDNGDGTFKALQQNYNKKQYVTIDNMPYSGIIGAFIPNQILAERQEQNSVVEDPKPVETPQEQVTEPVVEPTVEQPQIDILDLVRRTIRGDFGNGQARKDALGSNYDEVQRQVNLNLQNGLTQWDKIRLF